MRNIVEILERLGQLEWYSVRPANIELSFTDASDCFPIVSLRYEGGNQIPYERLREVLNDFPCASNWQISGENEKNITIAPLAVIVNGVPSLEKCAHLAVTSPELAKSTKQEFVELMRFFESSLR